jgi:putative NADH-flavin reductase
MRIAVFGANGKTGRELVREALERGHEVTAFDLGFEGFPFDKVETVEGDARDAGDVGKALEGCDAALSGLGVTRNTPGDVVSAGVSNIADGMEQHGIDRLVALTGAGAKLESEKIGLNDRLLNLAATVVMPGAVQDGRRMVREIQSRDLDWTVVRAPRLTQAPETGEYTVSDQGPTVFDSISRADVADYMLEAVERGLEVRRMPFIY